MKKLRFFGLLVTVVLLAFGLSVGCNNDTTTTGGESDPVVYRGTSNGRAIEITFDTAPISARARATEPRPGDNYLITIDGQTASSGWIELQEGGLIRFHDTTGKGDFDGQLIGQTVIVQVPGEPASLTAGLVGGSGTYNPGGGGLGGNVGGGTGTPGTTAPPSTVTPGDFPLLPLAATNPAVPVASIILTSDDYIILDEDGNGELQLAVKVLPENATNKAISVWTLSAETVTTGTPAIDGDATVGNTGTKGLLTITGGNAGDNTNTITITPTIPNGSAGPANYTGTALTITVYQHGTVPPPRITLVDGSDDLRYIADKSSIKIDGESRMEIRYAFGADPTAVTGTVYTGPIPVSTSQTAAMDIRAIAVNSAGIASPVALTRLAGGFTQAQVIAPVIRIQGGDYADAAGTLAGFILGTDGAKASTFTIESPIPGAEIYYNTADGAAAPTAATNAANRYTGPVTITQAMLSNVPDFQISVITYASGYGSIAASTITAITQAIVRPTVITVGNGVPMTESVTGNTAEDTYHLATTNQSTLMITTPTRGAQIFYAVDAGDPTGGTTTRAAVDALYTTVAATNRRFEWTTPVNISDSGLTLVTANTVVSDGTTVNVRAYATKAGYLDSTSGGATVLALLSQAQVRWPLSVRHSAAVAAVTANAQNVNVTSAAGWDDLKFVEIYCQTPGAVVAYTLTPTVGGIAGTATAANTTAASDKVTYVDLSGYATTLTATGDLVTLTIGGATKTGYTAAAAGTLLTITFTRTY